MLIVGPVGVAAASRGGPASRRAPPVPASTTGGWPPAPPVSPVPPPWSPPVPPPVPELPPVGPGLSSPGSALPPVPLPELPPVLGPTPMAECCGCSCNPQPDQQNRTPAIRNGEGPRTVFMTPPG